MCDHWGSDSSVAPPASPQRLCSRTGPGSSYGHWMMINRAWVQQLLRSLDDDHYVLDLWVFICLLRCHDNALFLVACIYKFFVCMFVTFFVRLRDNDYKCRRRATFRKHRQLKPNNWHESPVNRYWVATPSECEQETHVALSSASCKTEKRSCSKE